MPSYVAEPGATSWWLPEATGQGDHPPGFSAADAESAERIEAALLALARQVDPDDPWSHPDAAALDAVSVAAWMREQGASPAVLRMHELSALSMAGGSEERRSLLGVLRQVAVAGAQEIYGEERWEGIRLATGSASLALRMGEELGDRVRLGAVVRAIDVARSGVTVTLREGETLQAAAVVCALPVGPLRDVAVTGVSEARLASLHRQRQARSAKVVAAYPGPVWRSSGANGLALSEGIVGSTWPQGPGALSMLVGPERLGVFLSAPPAVRRAEVLALLADLYGGAALRAGGLRGARLGARSLHAGLHRAVGAGRPDRGRAAARHARAAVLRRRLRPLGLRLHGGRGADRPLGRRPRSSAIAAR